MNRNGKDDILGNQSIIFTNVFILNISIGGSLDNLHLWNILKIIIPIYAKAAFTFCVEFHLHYPMFPLRQPCFLSLQIQVRCTSRRKSSVSNFVWQIRIIGVFLLTSNLIQIRSKNSSVLLNKGYYNLITVLFTPVWVIIMAQVSNYVKKFLMS